MSTAASQPAWTLRIPDFDGSRIEHFPRVFFSPSELDLARRRVQEQAWARAILERLVKEADAARTLALTPLDESWWKAAQTQPWEQTYPVIAEHTQQRPMAYAHPAAVCALAWSLTGDTRYADRACDLLLLLAGYSFEAQHFDVGLNFATWGMELLTTYDLVGSRLAPLERRSIDAAMTRLARAELQNDIYWIQNNIGGGLNNHLAWHKMMLGLLGLFYGQSELVKFCLEGPRGMLALLGDGLVDDGLWCESSLNYHFTAIYPMIRLADAQRRMREQPTLFDREAANGRTLRQAFDAMLEVLFPDLSVPPVGDAYAHRSRLCDSPVYEFAWAAWKDPRHAWLLSQSMARSQQALLTPDLPRALTPPAICSRLLPEHGFVFLRDVPVGASAVGAADEHQPASTLPDTGSSAEASSYWNGRARCLFFSYDRSGVHSHADKLSAMWFGHGQLLLADREARASVPHAFSSQVQRELNRGTICHNTVMIDGQDQQGTARVLRLIEYHVTNTEQRSSIADLEGLLYPGIRQMRTVILTPEYVLDVFQVDCGALARRIDWIAHPFEKPAQPTTETRTSIERGRLIAFPSGNPWRWLRYPREMKAAMPLAMEWRCESVSLRLSLLTADGASLISCGFPSSDQRDSPSLAMILIRQQAVRATIAAAWTAGEEEPSKIGIARQPTGDLRYRLDWSEGSREHIIPAIGSL